MRALLVLALFGACIGSISAQNCNRQLKGWDQCGGKSNCNSGSDQCGNFPWKDACCPSGYTCTGQGEWFWQCSPGNNGGGNNNPPNNGGGNNPQPQPQPQPPSGPGQYKPDPPVPAKKIGSDWDWGQALGLSFLFYEAQRSGKLPENNRINWRGDSGLEHKINGRDVTGGWYDAGDNVKFNFPMAWSAHVLTWSIVDFADGYYKAGQLGTALANVKWVTDYFIKCIGDGKKDIVVQVGSGSQDHGIWGRPEDIKNPVPVYTVNPGSPGSDVVAAMGATLGAAAVAFKRADEAYSKQLLQSAIKAYEFATAHIGKYSDSVSDAGAFYRSSNLYDDIATNAIWLYIATGQETYKTAAFNFYMKHYKEEDGPGVWDNFDWDSHSWAAVVLLQRYFPEDPILQLRVTKFVRAWTKGESDIVKFTPKGLAYSGPWGSLRHVGNAMFLLKAFAVGSPNADPAVKQAIDCTVRKQLGYILGDTGRSFVVGYGTNPPARPHHRASSCPPLGVQCTWDYFNNPGPNPHTLYGALVGGPGGNDDYNDDRNDYIKNEVATDYNAGFTGALAAAARGLLPCQANAALNVPVFAAEVGPLPKLAIMILPTPYIQQAMEVVSGSRVDAIALPAPAPAKQELPAIAPPKATTPLPAPVPVAQPITKPTPAPVPTRAPRPPQSLCFQWNERTWKYEATTVEARDFLAALLGLKESSKGSASVQHAIDIAARRMVRPPIGGASAMSRHNDAHVEHECNCPAAVACPAAAPCPACPAPAEASAPLVPKAQEAVAPLTPKAPQAPQEKPLEAPIKQQHAHKPSATATDPEDHESEPFEPALKEESPSEAPVVKPAPRAPEPAVQKPREIPTQQPLKAAEPAVPADPAPKEATPQEPKPADAPVENPEKKQKRRHKKKHAPEQPKTEEPKAEQPKAEQPAADEATQL